MRYHGTKYEASKLNQFLKLIFGVIILSFVFISCEEEYIPELDGKYTEVLVIDGMITNAEPPYTVKLSFSTNVYAARYIEVTGYLLRIVDNFGNVEVLTETEPGTYKTSPDGIQGIVGRKYKIMIQSVQGKLYESDFTELKEPLGIQSVYPEVEYEESNEFPYTIPGYRFLIDTYTAQTDSTYLLWSMEETYKYESDFLIHFYYDGILHAFQNSDSLKTCWKTATVFPFFVESTLGLSEPRFTAYPLHLVDTRTRKLSIKYSLLVKQLSISSKAYRYWNSIKEQNTESGELYSRQPYQLRGNVINTSDVEELILGYFMVAGVSEKRIFVERPDPTIGMYYQICELTSTEYEDYGWMFLGGPSSLWPLYITQDGDGVNALPNQQCIDCTKKGGTLEKPDFWED